VATAATEAATGRRSLSPSTGRLDPEAAGAYVGRLFAEQGRMVLGLCRLLLRDPVDADDAAQQVFLSAHQALLRGSVPRDGAAWIAAIARNECRARIHARMREPLALPELPSNLPDPLAAAIRTADLDAVWAALGALPRRQRRALLLRELGGLSYHELGRVLGMSHSAVESLLFRARQRVRSLVAGANAFLAPIALREQLTQLIPGFDSSSGAVVARVVALPVAWKLAGAALSAGVVATGASGLHHQPRPHEVAQPRPPATRTVVATTSLPSRQTMRASVTAAAPVVHRRRHRGREEHHASHEQEHSPTDVVETSNEGPQAATARVEESHEGPAEGGETAAAEDRSGDDRSGRDGGGSSGSDDGSSHSGPG